MWFPTTKTSVLLSLLGTMGCVRGNSAEAPDASTPVPRNIVVLLDNSTGGDCPFDASADTPHAAAMNGLRQLVDGLGQHDRLYVFLFQPLENGSRLIPGAGKSARPQDVFATLLFGLRQCRFQTDGSNLPHEDLLNESRITLEQISRGYLESPKELYLVLPRGWPSLSRCDVNRFLDRLRRKRQTLNRVEVWTPGTPYPEEAEDARRMGLLEIKYLDETPRPPISRIIDHYSAFSCGEGLSVDTCQRNLCTSRFHRVGGDPRRAQSMVFAGGHNATHGGSDSLDCGEGFPILALETRAGLQALHHIVLLDVSLSMKRRGYNPSDPVSVTRIAQRLTRLISPYVEADDRVSLFLFAGEVAKLATWRGFETMPTFPLTRESLTALDSMRTSLRSAMTRVAAETAVEWIPPGPLRPLDAESEEATPERLKLRQEAAHTLIWLYSDEIDEDVDAGTARPVPRSPVTVKVAFVDDPAGVGPWTLHPPHEAEGDSPASPDPAGTSVARWYLAPRSHWNPSIQ